MITPVTIQGNIFIPCSNLPYLLRLVSECHGQFLVQLTDLIDRLTVVETAVLNGAMGLL